MAWSSDKAKSGPGSATALAWLCPRVLKDGVVTESAQKRL